MRPHWLATVHHDGSEKYVPQPYPRFGDQVRVHLRVGENAPVQRVFLRTFPDGEQQFIPMQRAAHKTPVRWWEADLPVMMPVMPYRFMVEAADGTDFRLLADFAPLEWLSAAVFYQIFPDSFVNGDPSNDPQPGDYEHRSHRPHTPPWGAPRPSRFAQRVTFYGGDL